MESKNNAVRASIKVVNIDKFRAKKNCDKWKQDKERRRQLMTRARTSGRQSCYRNGDDFIHSNQIAQGQTRDSPTMDQAVVVLTCSYPKMIDEQRELDNAQTGVSWEKGTVYAPPSKTGINGICVRGNVVLCDQDDYLQSQSRNVIAAGPQLRVYDYVNNLSKRRRCRVVGIATSESDSTDGSGDTAITIRIAGTATTTNTGKEPIYPLNRVYAIPDPNLINTSKGPMPHIRPYGQPADKVLATIISLPDTFMFEQILSIELEIYSMIERNENTIKEGDKQSADAAFSNIWSELNKYCNAELGRKLYGDETYMKDYGHLYGCSKLLDRLLMQGNTQWRKGQSEADHLVNMTQACELLRRALHQFHDEREDVVKHLYLNLTTEANTTMKAELSKWKGNPMRWIEEVNGVHVPNGTNISQMQELVATDLHIINAECVSYMERFYLGLSLCFSPPGSDLDVCLGVK